METDEYGEIINSEKTFEQIAARLKMGQSIIIGWTDQESTHYDILFTGGAYKQEENYLQRGLRGNELFVSVMSRGAFGFNLDGEKSSGYIAEKLHFGCYSNITMEKLAELINGVIRHLTKRESVEYGD